MTVLKAAQITGSVRGTTVFVVPRPAVLCPTNTHLAVNILQDLLVRDKPHQFLTMIFVRDVSYSSLPRVGTHAFNPYPANVENMVNS